MVTDGCRTQVTKSLARLDKPKAVSGISWSPLVLWGALHAFERTICQDAHLVDKRCTFEAKVCRKLQAFTNTPHPPSVWFFFFFFYMPIY